MRKFISNCQLFSAVELILYSPINFVLCTLHDILLTQIPDYKNAVMVARNPGSAKKATSYAERLRVGIAVIHGEVKEGESDEIDGRYSPPLDRNINSRLMDVAVGGVPAPMKKEKPPLTGV